MTPARHELPPEPLKDENDYGGWEAAGVVVVGDGRVVVVVVVDVVLGGREGSHGGGWEGVCLTGGGPETGGEMPSRG